MIEKLRRHLVKIGFLLKYENLFTTFMICLAELGALLKINRPTGYRYHEYFDTRSGLTTAGVIAANDLDMRDERRVHSNEYAATPPPLLHHVLSSLDIPFERFEFIDFGSGKGRVLLLAARFPFAKIRGIELARPLHELARRNIAAYRGRARSCRDIDSLCMDVVDFELPNRPAVLYFFNPFDETIFERILANIGAARRASPQRTILIYYHASALDRELIERLGLFRQISAGIYDGHTWLIYDFDPSVRSVHSLCLWDPALSSVALWAAGP